MLHAPHGSPLILFQGSLFGPYTPLQQLDVLADFGTKSYIVGSTNSLLLQQNDRYSDILINLDENSISITSPSLRSAISLTAADRRWMDFICQQVNETWDDANPSRPKNMQYAGSEEFIRSQFEAYILGLISSVKFHNFMLAAGETTKGSAAEDPAVDFGLDWIEAWMRTENFRIWDAHTDSNLFAVSEPKHPMAGGLTIEDVQRRLAEQVKELHLDERLAQGREILGRNFAAGREKASTMLNRLYSDMEYLRESQRRRAEDARRQSSSKPPAEKSPTAYPAEFAKAQQTVQSVGNKAGAYVSSWANWAGERRKQGWGRKPKSEQSDSSPNSPIEKDYQMVSHPGFRRAASSDANGMDRPATQASFSESILSGASTSPGRPVSGESFRRGSAAREKDADALGETREQLAAKKGSDDMGDGMETVDLGGQTAQARDGLKSEVAANAE